MNRQQLKAAAKAQIRGNIGILFVIALIIGLICSIPIANLILAPAFMISICIVYLNLTNGKKPEVVDAFSGVKTVLPAWILTLLVGLFTALWSMLFVIPGIVKGISYSMAPYILAENPQMSALDAIRESKRITQGHKWELFVLELSFIGWTLVVGFTFGIAAIWVIPYMQATYANAYNALKAPQATAYNNVTSSDEAFLNSQF